LSASHATADRHRGGQVDEEGADAAASQRGVARRRQDVTAAGTCWGRAEAVLDGGVPARPGSGRRTCTAVRRRQRGVARDAGDERRVAGQRRRHDDHDRNGRFGVGGTGVRRVNVRSQQHADTTAKRRLSVELLASIIRVRHYVRSAVSLVPSVL